MTTRSTRFRLHCTLMGMLAAPRVVQAQRHLHSRRSVRQLVPIHGCQCRRRSCRAAGRGTSGRLQGTVHLMAKERSIRYQWLCGGSVRRRIGANSRFRESERRDAQTVPCSVVRLPCLDYRDDEVTQGKVIGSVGWPPVRSTSPGSAGTRCASAT